MIGEPADPARRAEWRAARREAMRRFHPDLGGDPDAYVAALDAVDRAYGVAPAGPRIHSPLHRRARRSLARALRTRTRAARGRLPRGMPGARRYTDL